MPSRRHEVEAMLPTKNQISTGCAILRLPAELRLMIYEFLPVQIIHFQYEKHLTLVTTSFELAILHVNRRIRSEAMSILGRYLHAPPRIILGPQAVSNWRYDMDTTSICKGLSLAFTHATARQQRFQDDYVSTASKRKYRNRRETEIIERANKWIRKSARWLAMKGHRDRKLEIAILYKTVEPQKISQFNAKMEPASLAQLLMYDAFEEMPWDHWDSSLHSMAETLQSRGIRVVVGVAWEEEVIMMTIDDLPYYSEDEVVMTDDDLLYLSEEESEIEELQDTTHSEAVNEGNEAVVSISWREVMTVAVNTRLQQDNEQRKWGVRSEWLDLDERTWREDWLETQPESVYYLPR